MFFKNKNKKLIIFSVLSAFIFIFSNFALAQETIALKNGDICSSSPSCPEKIKNNSLYNFAVYNIADNTWIATYPNGSQDVFNSNGDKIKSTINNSGIGQKTTTTYDSTGKVLEKKTESTGGVGSFLSDIGSGIFEKAISFLLVKVFVPTVSVIFMLGAWLVNFSLELNSTLMKMPIIKVGWSFARDFANLGFVLGIIFIAFSTIVRNKSYGMQSLLVKFIQTAILINFSLVISGIIIDFAGIITAYFLNSAAAMTGNNDLSSGLANLLRIKDLIGVDGSSTTLSQGAALLGTNFAVGLASLIFIILFGVFSAIILLALAIMLLCRFATLAFLLILSPLAWFSGIFPKINYSNMWWNSFLRWVFFAPASSFFIYLSVSSLNITDSDITSVSNSSALAKSIGDSTIIQGGLGQIASMIIVLAFLLGSLIVANKLGIMGASTALGYATSFQNWTLGKMKGLGARAATGAARGTSRGLGWENWAEKQQKAAQEGNLKGLTGRLKAITASGIQGLQRSSSSQSIDKYEKEVGKISADDLARQYVLAFDPAKKAAIIKKAVKDGKIDKLSPDVDFSLYEKYGGNTSDLCDINILFCKDKDEKKSISYLIKNKTNKEELKKAFGLKLKSMSPEDFKKSKWDKVIDGLNLNAFGLAKDEWEKEGGYQDALLEAIAENVKGKEFSKMMEKSSISTRTKINNLLLAKMAGLNKKGLAEILKINDETISKIDGNEKEKEEFKKSFDGALKNADLLKKLSFEQIKKIKEANESIYNYSKSIHSAISGDSSEEKKDESKKETGMPSSGSLSPGGEGEFV